MITEITDLFGDRDEEAMYQAAESLAASLLTDQEAVERHTAKRVAGEIVDIMNHCETFQDVKDVIWQKYGVE